MADVPRDLEEAAFDDWLWRKDETSDNQYANLRDLITFPYFADLPEENELKWNYYRSIDGYRFSPVKHWCFLGEIDKIRFEPILQLTVRDKCSRQIPISFHTKEYGGELDKEVLKEKYTVAVLYADQHQFLNKSIGIRHDDPTSFKVSCT